MAKRTIVWLRNDLRIRDNEILFRASERGAIYPVYCFDPRQFQENELGFPKTGAFRAEFLSTSLANLRKNLKNIGGPLIIRQALPEKIIPQLADLLHADAVYAIKEVTVVTACCQLLLPT